MKRAFTLIEMMIVVAIIGILAAIVLPVFQGDMTEAKEAAAKDNLRILRNTIELYAARHQGVAPGYNNDNMSTTPSPVMMNRQILNTGYLTKFPKNPFNDKTAVKMIGNSENFPTEPALTSIYGWLYKPAAKAVKLNWPGKDSKGVVYMDY